jgi:hypothetical protein
MPAELPRRAEGGDGIRALVLAYEGRNRVDSGDADKEHHRQPPAPHRFIM